MASWETNRTSYMIRREGEQARDYESEYTIGQIFYLLMRLQQPNVLLLPRRVGCIELVIHLT